MKVKKPFIKAIAFLLVLVICYCGFVSLLSDSANPSFSAVAEESEDISTGTLDYSDGSFYQGDILYGRIRTGTGTYTWSTGQVYTGVWENDSPSGTGKLEWPGLGVYEGDFYNGKREGIGTFTWSYDGDPPEGAPLSYEGSWSNDKINGQGKLFLSGIGTYSGNFDNQMRSGNGTFTWLNGDVYSGSWAKDMVDGHGSLKTNDGTVLEGDFAKGSIKNGTISYPISSGTVIREVKNGKAQDTVEITYKDGTKVSGKVKGDIFTGNVTIKYASGDTYVGTIKNGMKDGKGTYTWKSGAHYVGDWVNDKMSGSGKYYYGRNELTYYLMGTFKNGVPDGKLTYMTDKLKYQTTWSGGKCTSIVYKK